MNSNLELIKSKIETLIEKDIFITLEDDNVSDSYRKYTIGEITVGKFFKRDFYKCEIAGYDIEEFMGVNQVDKEELYHFLSNEYYNQRSKITEHILCYLNRSY